ncbi:MAG: DUF1493 family protein [Bacteroidota bacterium]
MNKENIANEIKEIIHSKFGLDTNEITEDCRIEEDLDITGVQAEILLETLVDNYKIDLSGFKFARYFGEEGFDPLGIRFLLHKIFRKLITKRSSHELTIVDLINWIERGHWVDPPS